MEIVVENISYSYLKRDGSRPVLRGISFQVVSGEFVAIVGPSGCGKSTLLNIIGGFLRPVAGYVRAGDKEIFAPGPDRIMIFQRSALFPFRTAEQNVEFGLTLQGLPPEAARLRSRDALAAVGLSAFAEAYPRELSEGMKKLVELARAMVIAAPAILFDEPFASLDALTRCRMHQYIQQLTERRPSTIVWVTHDLEEAVMLADRVIVMASSPGRVVSIEEVALPRPRTEAVRSSEAVQSRRRKLLKLLGSDAR